MKKGGEVGGKRKWIISRVMQLGSMSVGEASGGCLEVFVSKRAQWRGKSGRPSCGSFNFSGKKRENQDKETTENGKKRRK